MCQHHAGVAFFAAKPLHGHQRNRGEIIGHGVPPPPNIRLTQKPSITAAETATESKLLLGILDSLFNIGQLPKYKSNGPAPRPADAAKLDRSVARG